MCKTALSISFLQNKILSWGWVTVKDFKKNSPGNFGLTKRRIMGRIWPAKFILVGAWSGQLGSFPTPV
jgi:hypothetical protein